VKRYWEIILENHRNAGWNCGSMATTDGKGRSILGCGRRAQRPGRFIVHADEMRTAFLELQAAIDRRFEPQMESHS